jgi:hypothetical protein
MINFEDCPINDRVYGGAAGRKLGVVYEGQNYILKFPGNLKDKQLKNIKMSFCCNTRIIGIETIIIG